MEALVTIIAVGAYAERQYQKQVPAGHALHREGCVEAQDMGREQ